MVQISVITPSVRAEGLDIVLKALKRQQCNYEWEWIIVGPEKVREWHNKHFNNQWFPMYYVAEPKRKKGDVWSLNKAYNMAIECASGKLIISWQDYTYAKPDTLERFAYHFDSEPKTLVSAVGNKYSDDTFTVMTWKDPREREDQGTYYQCFFNDIEFNLAAIPQQAFYDIGGFDEYLDKYFGMDGYSVVERLSILGGYDFKLDQSIKSYSLEHARPINWEIKNAIHGPYNERRKIFLANPRLDYLR